MPARLSPLSWQIRGDLFAQLAAMEKTGLPALQALGLIRLPSAAQTRVTTMHKFATRGAAIAIAGRNSGVFTDLEANLIAAATSAGSPAPTYRRLADYYTQRAAQARVIKSRMLLPGFMLLTSLFVQPLPALVAGNLSAGRYFLHCLIPLIALATLFYFGKAAFKQQEGPPSAIGTAIQTLAMRLPLFGKMLIRSNIRDFFESLALMVEAGMPILQALPKALETVRLPPVRAAFSKIQPKIARGSTLTQALENISYLDDGQALALINTGEASGTLPEMLFRFAALETASINHFHEQMAAWLPRIIYAMVAAWVAYGILTGAGVRTEIPADLQ
ncbi:MAG TPA: type II secretion system F family protein [Burkholderiaceae bacterium]|jgi:general secretion pathway protein F|nr:type II secretion system F family protein [Burkholderiaceae bacterium]